MMKFLTLSMATLAAGGALASASAAVAGTGTSATGDSSAPRARLSNFICQRALEPEQRLVSTTAVMRPLKGTKKLELRFELLSRTATSPFTEVRGPNLGTWVSPTDPSTLGTRPADVWKLNHPVADLPAPATYKFVVTFRWIGAHHRVIGTAARSGPNCYQPELRPDLKAVSFDAQPIPSRPKRDEYTATMTDAGLTGAGPFSVEFTDGSTVRQHVVKHIDAHQTLTFDFVGPLCDASAPPTMAIDPTQQVDDYNRSNNSLTATCPVSPSNS